MLPYAPEITRNVILREKWEHTFAPWTLAEEVVHMYINIGMSGWLDGWNGRAGRRHMGNLSRMSKLPFAHSHQRYKVFKWRRLGEHASIHPQAELSHYVLRQLMEC